MTTREKQLDAWASLVLDYCQYHKLYTVSLADLHVSELFDNAKISRQLSIEGVRAVFDVLERRSE